MQVLLLRLLAKLWQHLLFTHEILSSNSKCDHTLTLWNVFAIFSHYFIICPISEKINKHTLQKNQHTALCIIHVCYKRFKMSCRLKAIAHWVQNFLMLFFSFFVFPILSYQNACNWCENAENGTWSEFFLTDKSFGGSVQTWLTQREVVFIF